MEGYEGLYGLMVLVGLMICFGGIYIRKIIAAVMGLIWGVTAAVLFLMYYAGGFLGIAFLLGSGDEDSTGYIVMALFIIMVAVGFFVKFERLCAVINAFLTSFVLMLLILLLCGFKAGALLVLLSLLLSCVAAYLSYLYYTYGFILVTGFLGALIASTGVNGLMYNLEEGYVLIVLGTLVLGCAGSAFQIRKLQPVGTQSRSGEKNNSLSGQDESQEEQIAGVPVFSIGHVLSELIKQVETSNAVQELMHEKYCIALAVLGFVILPLADDYFIGMAEISVIVNWMAFILRAAAFSCVIYIAYNRSVQTGILYCCICLIGEILEDRNWFFIDPVGNLCWGMEAFLLLGCSLLIQHYFRTNLKYLVSIVCVIFYQYMVLRWFITKSVYWCMYRSDILPIIALIAATCILVKVKCDINIFDIASCINERAGKKVLSNKQIVLVLMIVVLSGIACFGIYSYIKKQQLRADSAAGKYEKIVDRQNSGKEETQTENETKQNSGSESQNDVETQGSANDNAKSQESAEKVTEINDNSSKNAELSTLLTNNVWEVLCITDLDGKVQNPDQVLGEEWDCIGGMNSLRFYAEDSNFPNCYGLVLLNYTNNEPDGMRWGEFECDGNEIRLKKDNYGGMQDERDTLILQYMKVKYCGETVETLTWTDQITDVDGNTAPYKLYFAKQLDTAMIRDAGAEDNQELISALTEDVWEVYCGYDYTGEPVLPEDVFGQRIGYNNSLCFKSDGTFTWNLYGYTAEYENSEISGIYKCNGNRVTLYPDSSSDVIRMEYTQINYQDFTDMSLFWYGKGYWFYLVTPAFYGGN